MEGKVFLIYVLVRVMFRRHGEEQSKVRLQRQRKVKQVNYKEFGGDNESFIRLAMF